MMQLPPNQVHETRITGLKIPFGDVFVLVGKIYAAILLWSLLIGIIVGIIFLIISIIGGIGMMSLFRG
ncbi:MAG: hypothetical protein HPY85_11460 [Anaerolineae bacterium]|nr:hypothetical protein [Anaerolineae bacterium]